MSRNQFGLPVRKNIRLASRDYTAPGAYFITVVTHQRSCILSKVEKGRVVLTDIGLIVQEEWMRTSDLRPGVLIEQEFFVAMPNHIHGLLWILNENGQPATYKPSFRNEISSTLYGASSIPTIVGLFKSQVTKHSRQQQSDSSLQIWQRGYHDRFIRNENELRQIREYIQNNPSKWR